MRISGLSERSGIPVPTIKYYLREGLLHRGEPTAANQAVYDDSHVRRLRLIRALVEIGELPIAAIRSVVEALGNEGLPLHQVMGVAHHALGPHRSDPPDDDVKGATDEIDAFLRRRRWRVSPDAPSRRSLAEALVALRRLDRDVDVEVFDHYADVAADLASWELGRISVSGSRSDAVEGAVVGTVIFEAAFSALRRLAQEHHSSRRPPARRPQGA